MEKDTGHKGDSIRRSVDKKAGGNPKSKLLKELDIDESIGDPNSDFAKETKGMSVKQEILQDNSRNGKDRLVERERVTEREKWFSADRTVKVRETIFEKERFENSGQNGVHDKPRGFSSTIKNNPKENSVVSNNDNKGETDRLNYHATPKSGYGIVTPQTIQNLSYASGHDQRGQTPGGTDKTMNGGNKKLEQRSIDFKGLESKEFPKIQQRVTPGSISNTMPLSTHYSMLNHTPAQGQTSKKYGNLNNSSLEDKYNFDYRRKTSNPSAYGNWQANKTQGSSSQNPTPVNFDKRGHSLDAPRTHNSISPAPVRINRDTYDKNTPQRSSFEKRRVTPNGIHTRDSIIQDGSRQKSHDPKFGDRRGSGTGSGSKTITKVLRKIIEKNQPHLKNLKPTTSQITNQNPAQMGQTFGSNMQGNGSEKDRSLDIDNEKMGVIFYSRQDSMDSPAKHIKGSLPYQDTNSKIFRTFGGIMQGKAFRSTGQGGAGSNRKKP